MAATKKIIPRRNFILCALVQAGISMANKYGWVTAAQFMTQCNIPGEVMERVLLDPINRRKNGVLYMEWIQYL